MRNTNKDVAIRFRKNFTTYTSSISFAGRPHVLVHTQFCRLLDDLTICMVASQHVSELIPKHCQCAWVSGRASSIP